MAARIGVFFDWQNCIFGAKDAFDLPSPGDVNPLLLAGILAGLRPPGEPNGRLEFVHIHTGMASQEKDRRTYAANRRQFAKWQSSSDRLTVYARTIAYRGTERAEKGVDVALAIDVVRCVIFDDLCDVAILVCADTDQLPTLELLAERKGEAAVEVAGWVGGEAPPLLDIPHYRLRQHRLAMDIFRKTEDHTDYNVSHVRRRAADRW
jgi:hypothetical protein